ncbi:hypothetical protein [Actinomadura rudentiformis]|uniref:Uncharacterized protein n=1 Tax=Actinomadura rudentiformis TaxID=359158 RepID=A0A6H9Y8B5_9ACTN|nr:hypothetical protein [Actinomadura rudentiformis]KAB2341091.1 hypothetical protein F8566_43140 [Actinomadura rudentiformis]
MARRRHGLAGLLVALFVVAGLVFTYGLGHAAPMRVCTAHLTSVPADVADALAHEADHTATASGAKTAEPGTAAEPVKGVPGKAVPLAAAPVTARAPLDLPPLDPASGCLSLAILLSLMILALAARPTRAGGVLPARVGWIIGIPWQRAPFSPSLASLQVLRL